MRTGLASRLRGLPGEVASSGVQLVASQPLMNLLGAMVEPVVAPITLESVRPRF